MSFQLKTFKDILDSILSELNATDEDSVTVEKLKRSINRRYTEIASKKKWKWLRESRRSLKVSAKYTTGTISLASGSRAVTGVGTAFVSSNKYWFLKPVGPYPAYRVITVLDGTNLLLASNHTGTSIVNGTYILYQSEIALPPDCEDLDDIRLETQTLRLIPRGPRAINELRQRNPERQGPPRYYSIDGTAEFSGPPLGQFILGFDFLGTVKTKALQIYPSIPDADYTLPITYKLKISELVNDDDEPLIPIEHRSVLFYSVLSDWSFSISKDTTGAYYQNLYKAELKEMESKYTETDDAVEMIPMKLLGNNKYLRYSSSRFDTGD